jgi:hypothetical protein
MFVWMPKASVSMTTKVIRQKEVILKMTHTVKAITAIVEVLLNPLVEVIVEVAKLHFSR